MKKNNLILVTGLPRSGTSWVGNTIAQGSSIKYLNEPFNTERGRKNCPLIHHYQHVDDNDPQAFQDEVKSISAEFVRHPPFILPTSSINVSTLKTPLKVTSNSFLKRSTMLAAH